MHGSDAAKPARLLDVAQAAGLAPATVSRFLNGGIELPQPTAERIRAAVARLGYRPNPYARSLSRGKSDTLELAIPDIQNLFFAKLASAVEQAAAAAGIAVLLCSTRNRTDRELASVERLHRNVVDGLLFATNHADSDRLAEAINQARGKVVLVDEDVAGAAVSKIFPDNVAGGTLAGRHLLEAGHRRVAYIGGPSTLMSGIERGEGFRRAVREAGPDASVLDRHCPDYVAADGYRTMCSLLDDAPQITGVFVGSDELLLGAAAALRERGLRIGTDLSVVTFDDVAPLDFFDPPITAIRQPVAQIGRRAVDRLLATTQGPDRDAVCERLPVELVPRGSVAAPRPTTGRRRRPTRNEKAKARP